MMISNKEVDIKVSKSNRELKNKMKIIISQNSIYVSLPMFTSFRNLVDIILQKIGLISLPKEFGILPHLQRIQLLENRLMNTTKFTWEWLKQAPIRRNLKFLDINKNALAKLPLQITCLKNLTDLCIMNNRIDFLPKEFGILCGSLYFLDLSFNCLGTSEQSAWEWLEQIPIENNLLCLNIENNSLTELPLQFSCLKSLNFLYINHNKIVSLPAKLGILPLKQINLSHNCLRYGQFNNIWTWLQQVAVKCNLEYLNLTHNSLTEIPIQITCLNLKELYLSHNEIIFLPKAFGTLPLIMLDLSHNYLGKSGQYSWRWLKQTRIRNNLLYLNISHNYLMQLPLQLKYMKSLYILDASSNKIKFLPKELGTLPSLAQLYLKNNYLGQSNQNAWKWLEQDVIRNNLLDLDLCNNLLTKLPLQIEKLNAINILRLNQNNLKCLPRNLGNLHSLKILDVSENNLLYLPATIAYLINVNINVEENPFNKNGERTENVIREKVDENSKMLSLVEWAAKVITKSGINYTNVELPPILVTYLSGIKYCIVCKIACFYSYEQWFIKYFDFRSFMHLSWIGSENIEKARFKCYLCSPHCINTMKLHYEIND